MRVTGVASCTGRLGAELRQQRAEALAAERVDVALDRAREIHRRDLVEILAAAERPEHELDRRPPVAEILRQRLLQLDVGLAARGILDRAVRAHECGEKILQLAFARVAPADAQLLARRRRIDVEARCAARASPAD